MLAKAMAYLGGAILVLLTVLNCISIFGRALVPLDIGIGPIRGIYDITEVGIGVSIFAFLPWCQLNRGHASVDLFTPVYPKPVNLLLDIIIDLLMFIAAAVGSWRLYLGMVDKLSFGETTFIAQIPVGYAYMACLVGAVCFTLISGFCALRSARNLIGSKQTEFGRN